MPRKKLPEFYQIYYWLDADGDFHAMSHSDFVEIIERRRAMPEFANESIKFVEAFLLLNARTGRFTVDELNPFIFEFDEEGIYDRAFEKACREWARPHEGEEIEKPPTAAEWKEARRFSWDLTEAQRHTIHGLVKTFSELSH